MFLDFFGLKEQPFGATPDPRYLYWSRSHREALASLYYAVKADRGFATIIAPPGMGKTTLLFQLLEHLRKTYLTSFLFQSLCSPAELLRYLMTDLGCDSGEQDPVKLHAKLNQILLSTAHAGRQLVIVIDEAQNLDSSVLEMVRLLSNFEMPNRKLIQIVLSGQPQLEGKLVSPALLQLRQRISTVSRLDPLDPSEIRDYIEHRLKSAGYAGRRLFEPEALAMITSGSSGVPRIINSLCFNSLSLGFARKKKRIDAGIVQKVMEDMDLSLPSRPSTPSEPEDLAGDPTALREALRVNRWTTLPSGDSERLDHVLTRSRRRLRRHRVGVVLSLAVLAVCATAAYIMRGSSSGPAPGAVEAAPLPAPVVSVTIERNETIESIVMKRLGRKLSPQLIEKIMELNPQLSDPNLILVGDTLLLPAVSDEPIAAGGDPAESPSHTQAKTGSKP